MRGLFAESLKKDTRIRRDCQSGTGISVGIVE
jgi:hypothetical protein